MAKQYQAVNGITTDTESIKWKPFLKQLHISSGIWTLSFMHGLATGAPTVFIPQLRKEWNSTVTIDDELASWFYSTANLSALAWVLVLPALSRCIGRKIPYLASCTAISIFFVLVYFSSAPYHIFIAQAIQGFVNACSLTTITLIISEYSNHRYRGMYLNIQYTTFYWGMWVSNTIGTFFYWKYIAIFGLICASYSFTVSFYPESPKWLACKGKFDKCKKAHRWLHGSSPEAEKELQDLISSQINYPRENKMTFSLLMKTFMTRQFYMPLLLLILIGAQYNFSGKFICSIYAIDILKKLTNNENTAYTGMLILDGVTVLGMYIGSVLPKFMKVRPLFIKLSILSVSVMFVFSLYLYLQNLGLIQENNVMTLGFLVVYSLAMSSGPLVLCVPIYSEIICFKHQAISYVISSFVFLLSCTGMLKFSPLIFKQFGIHGSFLFFAISSSIATTLLYIYLPDTKNKTLVEIEKYFEETERVPEAETLNRPDEGDIRN